MRVVIATGGTGGHCYPAVLVAKALQSTSHQVLFLGGTRGFEADLAKENDVPFIPVRSKGFPAKINAAFLSAIGALTLGVIDAINALLRFHPDLVIGAGGYCSAPVIVASVILGFPFFLMEQNLLPGKVTRLFARQARKVLISFSESAKYIPGAKTTLTGTPVRKEILNTTKEEGQKKEARKRLGLDPDTPAILVMGASQGAQPINNIMVEMISSIALGSNNCGLSNDGLNNICKAWQWVHITGKSHFEGVLEKIRNSGFKKDNFKYFCFPYIENIGDAYAASDLLVARAGAGTIWEILNCGIPAVLVPYPYAAENHQLLNARHLANEGACVLLLERDLTLDRLVKEIKTIMDDSNKLSSLREKALLMGCPDALNKVISEILSIRRE